MTDKATLDDDNDVEPTGDESAAAIDDPDDAELAAAEAAVAAEGNTTDEDEDYVPHTPDEEPQVSEESDDKPEPEPQTDPEPQATEQPKPEEGEQPEESQKPSTQVPVDAVQDERRKRQEAERQAEYWQRVAAGELPDPRRGKPQQQAPQQAPQQSQQQQPEETTEDLDAELLQLAEDVDNAKISMKEFVQKSSEIERKKDALRAPSTQPQQTQYSDFYLHEKTKELETKNPWINNVPEEWMGPLQQAALKSLLRDPSYHQVRGTSAGDYRLREAIIDQAKHMNFDTLYAGEQQAQSAPTGNEQPAQPQTPAGSRPAASTTDLEAKQRLAQTAPPTPQGTSAPADSEWTDERIENMDDLDLENMSEEELDRIEVELDRRRSSRRVAA